jgi:hypothetical protein
MLRRRGIDALDGSVCTRTVSSQRPFYEQRSSPIVDCRKLSLKRVFRFASGFRSHG